MNKIITLLNTNNLTKIKVDTIFCTNYTHLNKNKTSKICKNCYNFVCSWCRNNNCTKCVICSLTKDEFNDRCVLCEKRIKIYMCNLCEKISRVCSWNCWKNENIYVFVVETLCSNCTFK